MTAAKKIWGGLPGDAAGQSGTVGLHVPILQRHRTDPSSIAAVHMCYATLHGSAHTCKKRTTKIWTLIIHRPIYHHKLVVCKPP